MFLHSVFFSFPQNINWTGNYIGQRKKLKVLFSLMELRIAEIRYGKVLLAHPSFFLPVEDCSLRYIFWSSIKWLAMGLPLFPLFHILMDLLVRKCFLITRLAFHWWILSPFSPYLILLAHPNQPFLSERWSITLFYLALRFSLVMLGEQLMLYSIPKICAH